MPPKESSPKSPKRRGDCKAKKQKMEVADDELFERDIVGLDADAYLNGICASDNFDKPDATVQEDALVNSVEKNILSKDSLNLKEFEGILSRDLDHVQIADSSNMLDKELAGDSGIPPDTEHEFIFNILEDF